MRPLSVRFLIYMLFDPANCLGDGAVAAPLLQALETGENAVGQEGLLGFDGLDVLVLTLLAAVPGIRFVIIAQQGQRSGGDGRGGDETLGAEVQFWVLLSVFGAAWARPLSFGGAVLPSLSF